MNEETKCEGATTLVGETPEIQKVMSILDKEIQRLDENIAILAQKLHPVLMSERPSEVDKDRVVRGCELAENIQKDIDAISRMNELLEELKYRVAL